MTQGQVDKIKIRDHVRNFHPQRVAIDAHVGQVIARDNEKVHINWANGETTTHRLDKISDWNGIVLKDRHELA